MPAEDRLAQSVVRKRAKELKEQGKEVKVEFLRLKVDNEWLYYSKGNGRRSFGKKASAIIWNVQGLRVMANDISKYLVDFDIVALQETWVEEKDPATTHGTGLPRQEARRGRAAGGIVVGIRNGMSALAFRGNSIGCWAAVEMKDKTPKLVVVYNNTSCEALKKELELEIEPTSNRENSVILAGDINGRIGTLGSRWEEGERSSKDRVTDGEGEQWIELMEPQGLTILNGNIDGDWQGEFTRIGNQNQEPSVLDYAGANEQALEFIQHFTVSSLPYSYHFPLEISFTTDSPRKEEKRLQKCNAKEIELYRRQIGNAGATHLGESA